MKIVKWIRMGRCNTGTTFITTRWVGRGLGYCLARGGVSGKEYRFSTTVVAGLQGCVAHPPPDVIILPCFNSTLSCYFKTRVTQHRIFLTVEIIFLALNENYTQICNSRKHTKPKIGAVIEPGRSMNLFLIYLVNFRVLLQLVI